MLASDNSSSLLSPTPQKKGNVEGDYVEGDYVN